MSLAYTKEALARSSSEAETLEQRLPASAPGRDLTHEAAAQASPLDAQLDAMMGDAPVCDVCGHITVRNGACYKCLNCGNSMGCS
jgi:ribonucleoside-diphosphate reductase alpha chain